MNFIKDSTIVKQINGSISSAAAASSGPLNNLNININHTCEKIAETFSNQNPLYTEIIAAFNSCSNFISDFEANDPDEFAEYLYIQGQDYRRIICDIENDSAETLVNSIEDVLEYTESSFLTMTDNAGEVVSIMKAQGVDLDPIEVYFEDTQSIMNVYPILVRKSPSDSLYHVDGSNILLGYYLIDGEPQYFLNTKLRTDYGRSVSLSNLVQSLARSLTINEIIQVTATQSLLENFSIDTLLGSIKAIGDTMFDGANQMISNICGAYATNGVVGVRTLLCSLARYTNTAEIRNGVLEFTDNSLLMPQEYIAGIVMRVAGAVLTIAGVIVAVWSRILGPLISTLGMMLLTLPNEIAYDYNTATTASIDDNSNVNTPCFPHGSLQGGVTVSADTEGYGVLSLLYNQGGTYKVHVPGGVLLVSCYEKLSQGLRFIWEFHVELATPTFGDVAQWTRPHIIRTTAYYGGGGIQTDFWNWAIQLYEGRIKAEYIESAWANRRSVDIINTGDGCLSIEDDNYVRMIYISNLALFYTWLEVCSLTGSREIVLNNGNTVWFPVARGSQQSVATPQSLGRLTGTICNPSWDESIFQGSNDDPDLFIWKYVLSYAFLSSLVNDTVHTENEYFIKCVKASAISTASVIPTWTEIALLCQAMNKQGSPYSTPSLSTTAYFANYKMASNMPKWNCITNSPHTNGRNGSVVYLLTYNVFLDSTESVTHDIVFCLKTPKYNRSSFIAWVFATVLVTIAAAVAVTAITIGGKRLITKQRAKRARGVEKSWQNYLNSPSNDNYKAYRTAVKKNNRFTSVFGGTKFAYDGMWNEVSDSTGLLSNFSSDSKNFDQSTNLDIVVKLIKG